MFVFLDKDLRVAFYRDDPESANWQQEELTLEMTFPFLAEKVCQTGQKVLFEDPGTGNRKCYEVRKVLNVGENEYQQVTAEDLVISELACEHIDSADLLNQTASAALSTALSGTLWALGNIAINPTSSTQVSRGSVWQAVTGIADDFNVKLSSRVTFDGNRITSRVIDILSPVGEFKGLRINITKNLNDPEVLYDDSECITAMYGYGANVQVGETTESKELDFSGVAWIKSADHPAKPLGQKYIEDPDATALYGHNGRPRFGYYQNSDIDDANLLLQKTWESLKANNTPSIQVSGTVRDLYRFGLPDVPMNLYDVVLVTVGTQTFQKQIVKLGTNLIDASETSVVIGDYIPNIVYIQKTNRDVSTGGGGGGGRGGRGSKEEPPSKFQTSISQNNEEIRLSARELERVGGLAVKNEAAISVQADRITAEVKHREHGEVAMYSRITQQADRITAEVSRATSAEGSLSSRLTMTADAITAEVTRATEAEGTLSGRIDVQSNKISLVVTEEQGENVVNAASIVLGINDQTGSYVKIKADTINLSGYVTASQLSATDAKIDNLMSGDTTAQKIKVANLIVNTQMTFLTHGVYWQGVTINGTSYHLMGYVG